MLDAKAEILKHTQAALEYGARIDLQTHPIEMDFNGGALTLEGEVPNIGCKKLALEVASSVQGVRSIIDRLRVTPEERAGDGAIREAVCKHLLGDVDFHNCGFRVLKKGQVEALREPTGEDSSGSMVVSVDDGVVTLAGQVISLSHKRLAGVLAWWARGCRDVVNLLEVIPPEEDNDDEVADALRLVLETDPLVPASQIGIRTHDHVVTLDGVVSTQEEKMRAEMDAWRLFAVRDVINRIEVRP
jgi:osmotically-inducible protein OsmY